MLKMPSIKELEALGFVDQDPDSGEGRHWGRDLPGAKREGAFNYINVQYNPHRIYLETVCDNADFSMPFDLPCRIDMKAFLQSIGAKI